MGMRNPARSMRNDEVWLKVMGNQVMYYVNDNQLSFESPVFSIKCRQQTDESNGRIS